MIHPIFNCKLAVTSAELSVAQSGIVIQVIKTKAPSDPWMLQISGIEQEIIRQKHKLKTIIQNVESK